MSFECAICSDALEQPKQDKQKLIVKSKLHTSTGVFLEPKKKHGDTGNKALVATCCGHLYHRKCLHKWFQARFRQNFPPSCPYCTEEFQDLDDIIDLDVSFGHRVSEQENNQGHQGPTNLKPAGIFDCLTRVSSYVGFVLALALATVAIIFIGNDCNCGV